MNRRTLLIVLAIIVGLALLGAVISIIALTPKTSTAPTTTSPNNQSTNSTSTPTPQPLTTQQSLQDNPPAQELAAFAETHKTSDLTDTNGKATFSVADQENIDGTYIYIDATGASGAQYLTIIDSSKSGAGAVFFGPEIPANITDDQLHGLPDSVYNYLNYKLHGNY